MDVEFDDRTALVVVDVQNDFADPDGGLYVEGGETTIPAMNQAITAARDAGAVVVYTQDWHPERTPHFEKDGGTWPVHGVQGTWGAELHPDLELLDDAPVVKKGVGGEDGYSAFTVRDPESGQEQATDLHAILQDAGVERVVVCGLAQDVCVLETVLDARDNGYETVVLADATAPVNARHGDGARAAARMAEAGARIA